MNITVISSLVIKSCADASVYFSNDLLLVDQKLNHLQDGPRGKDNKVDVYFQEVKLNKNILINIYPKMVHFSSVCVTQE